jgi:hypothetical protein
MKKEANPKKLPRNVLIVAITSFMTDVSSEMIVNTLPLFLKNVLGVKTSVIGLIEGVAESTASFLKLYSGWISDKLKKRKMLAVLGYGISTLSKPLFYFAQTWGMVAAARWGDRVGKGVRTAPRDALVADSTDQSQRGFAFGFHRAADTAGAFVGLLMALVIVWLLQSGSNDLKDHTFRVLVLVSLLPAALAVIILAVGAKDIPAAGTVVPPRFGFKSLGKNFIVFVVIVGIFELGNSSDAFIILRAQERGLQFCLYRDRPAGRKAFRPRRPPAHYHGRLGFVCTHVSGLGGRPLGSSHHRFVCYLRRILRFELWHGQSNGGRSCSSSIPWHGLRHLQRRPRTH